VNLVEQNDEAMTLTEAILLDYKEGLGEFVEKMPKIADSYKEFTAACFEEGHLSQKVKQLIALGISVLSQDETCIVYHTKGCLDQGCMEEEMLEVVGVTAAFGGGMAMSRGVTLVQQAIMELKMMRH
jgi:AhpD family alkylhydroperoxidase